MGILPPSRGDCFIMVHSCIARVAASKISGGLHLTDAQKKLVEEDAGQTLAQQENMQISGSQARQMVMQKLLRANEVGSTLGYRCSCL